MAIRLKATEKKNKKKSMNYKGFRTVTTVVGYL